MIQVCIGHCRKVDFHRERNGKTIANANGFIKNSEWFSGSVEKLSPKEEVFRP